MPTKYLAATVYGSSSRTTRSFADAFRQAFKGYSGVRRYPDEDEGWEQKTIEIASRARKRKKKGNKFVETKYPQKMARCELYGETQANLKEVKQTLESAFPTTEWVYPLTDKNHDELAVIETKNFYGTPKVLGFKK